jgi:hypothetical protein
MLSIQHDATVKLYNYETRLHYLTELHQITPIPNRLL